MFDSFLTAKLAGRRRFGAGAAISLAMHLTVVPAVLWITTKHKVVEARSDVEVVFFPPAQPAPPPPPPAAARRPKEHKPRPKPHPVVQQAVVPPKVVPEEQPEPPKEEPPPEDEGEGEGVEGGVPGGVTAGVPGGVSGGIGTAPPPPPPPPVRMEFNDAMTAPKMVSGPNPQYTERALEREVEGLMIVKCVVTVEGVVRECRVMQSLPFMDRAVVAALERRRYTPALLQGRPVEVDYTFSLRLSLPN
jgi:protein TonB